MVFFAAGEKPVPKKRIRHSEKVQEPFPYTNYSRGVPLFPYRKPHPRSAPFLQSIGYYLVAI
jgi:hypothetical protein